MSEDILPKAELSMFKRTMQICFGNHHIVGEPIGLEHADILNTKSWGESIRTVPHQLVVGQCHELRFPSACCGKHT